MVCSASSPYPSPGETLFVTAATRPTSFPELQTGRRIFEADTNRYWKYNGTTWIFDGNLTAAARAGVQLVDTAQSIATATLTDITWATETADPDGWTSGASATLTVPSGWDGVWNVSFNALWASSTLGTTPYAVAYVNGAVVYSSEGLTPQGVHTLSVDLILSATNTLKFAVFQNSGGPINATCALLASWVNP